jgi:hypothetical protein
MARIVFEKMDIGDERNATTDALEKIVAQQCVVRDASPQGAFKGRDVVYPLSDIDSFAEEVLVDIGNGPRVEIQTDFTLENLLERSSRCT